MCNLSKNIHVSMFAPFSHVCELCLPTLANAIPVFTCHTSGYWKAVKAYAMTRTLSALDHDVARSTWEALGGDPRLRNVAVWRVQTCASMVYFEVVSLPTVHPQFTHSSLTVHTTVHSQFTHVIYGVLVSHTMKEFLDIKTCNLWKGTESLFTWELQV